VCTCKQFSNAECAVLCFTGASPLQVELGANLFVYISLVMCAYFTVIILFCLL